MSDWSDEMNAQLRAIAKADREAKMVDRVLWGFVILAAVWAVWPW